MQFLEFLFILQKRGLSYAISKFLSFLHKRVMSYAIFVISFHSPKTRTIICNFLNIFLFSKNMDNHMQFLEFLFLLQKCGLSYVIFGISFPSPKMWTIICNFWNLFVLQKRGLSYAIS